MIFLRGPKPQSGILLILFCANTAIHNITIEFCRQYCLEIQWVNGPESFSPKENLIERVPPSSEMPQEQFHQPRIGIGFPNLLETINPERPLVDESRGWQTAMLFTE